MGGDCTRVRIFNSLEEYGKSACVSNKNLALMHSQTLPPLAKGSSEEIAFQAAHVIPVQRSHNRISHQETRNPVISEKVRPKMGG